MKINELKGIIAREGKTQTEVAKMLGITQKTFHNKLKRGLFNNDEIAIMTKELRISDFVDIFFTSVGT